MRAYLIIILLTSGAGWSFGQNYLGIDGGINISGGIFDRDAGVRAFQKITPYYGITYTYIPEGKKPGLTINFNVLDHGFQEINRDTVITFQLRGYELDLLSHLYITIRKTRLFINLGPSIAWLPGSSVDYPEVTALPPFNENNLNTVFLAMGGGPGITQSIGPIDLTVFGSINYFISDLYRYTFWDSNIISMKGGIRLQFSLGK